MSTDAPTPQRHHLGPNDWAQVKRLAFGGALALLLSKTFGWSYGLFYAIYPLLLMGLVPTLNAHIVRQFLYSASVNIAATTLIAGVLIRYPLVMTLAMFLFSAMCFWLMSTGRAFLFGAMSLASTHSLVHLASYADTDVAALYGHHLWATVLTVAIACLAYALFPDKEPRRPPPRPVKPIETIRHQVLLGASCATVSFVAFQIADLRDSLSAQVATILILYPMAWYGAKSATFQRLSGTLIGSSSALLIQLVLYTNYDRIILVIPLYFVGLLIFAAEHAREGIGPARGFGALTGLAALLGLATPHTDLFTNSLYRMASVAIGVTLTLFCVYATHLLLNRFAATRLIAQ